VVMAKTDIEQKRAAEREDWQKRGHAGTITAIDSASNKITVTTRVPGRTSTFTVEPGGHTKYRRYAPDSVRFADAQQSTAAALKVGDHVRVLGDREGDTIRAEIIVSGEFRNIAGTVKAVDVGNGEVRIVDLATKQHLVIQTGPDAVMRRIPPQMAEMLARRRALESNGEQQRSRDAAGTPTPERRQPEDTQQMLERMTALTLSDLKPGDALLVTSTAGKEPGRVTAITLLAGVEPLLRDPAQATDPRLGRDWNFDINIMP
jgi:hypothetical protein